MALLERVSTLVRANLNDLVDRAENPEKMIKQVILDMQNQFMQVKTQVAIAIADLHLLEKKQKENRDKEAEWMRKADNPYHQPYDDRRFPYVLTTYRVTEHHTAGGMSRWLSWLSELQPEAFHMSLLPSAAL